MCIFGCKCKLGDCGSAARRRKGRICSKERNAFSGGIFYYYYDSTNPLVGQAPQLIAALTGVLSVDVSADLIQGQKGQIPQGAAAEFLSLPVLKCRVVMVSFGPPPWTS